jgi:hypothetical protein
MLGIEANLRQQFPDLATGPGSPDAPQPQTGGHDLLNPLPGVQ